MNGKDPCAVCGHKKDCGGCVFEECWNSSYECQNTKCFLQYECGCRLDLDDRCKASTCYGES